MEPVDAQPPKTIEEVALSKVIDPFSEPYPLWHITGFRKLESILREGLIAEKYAQRIGKDDFVRRFPSSWNREFISLRRGGVKGADISVSPNVAILVDPQDDLIQASEKHWTPGDPFHPTGGEFLVKNRIAPREFKGLQLKQSIGELPSKYQATVSDIVALFQHLDPSRGLPIYGSDGLLWPLRMTREQLGDRVQSQI